MYIINCNTHKHFFELITGPTPLQIWLWHQGRRILRRFLLLREKRRSRSHWILPRRSPWRTHSDRQLQSRQERKRRHRHLRRWGQIPGIRRARVQTQTLRRSGLHCSGLQSTRLRCASTRLCCASTSVQGSSCLRCSGLCCSRSRRLRCPDYPSICGSSLWSSDHHSRILSSSDHRRLRCSGLRGSYYRCSRIQSSRLLRPGILELEHLLQQVFNYVWCSSLIASYTLMYWLF